MVPIDRPKNSTQHMSASKFFSRMLRPQPKKYRYGNFSMLLGVTFQSNKIKNFISLTLHHITTLLITCHAFAENNRFYF